MMPPRMRPATSRLTTRGMQAPASQRMESEQKPKKPNKARDAAKKVLKKLF